jgi:hypothetical protein
MKTFLLKPFEDVKNVLEFLHFCDTIYAKLRWGSGCQAQHNWAEEGRETKRYPVPFFRPEKKSNF